MAKGDKMAGIIDRNGKGDKRRPAQVESQQFNDNGAKAFGEEWLIPPVLRRRQEQAHETNDAS